MINREDIDEIYENTLLHSTGSIWYSFIDHPYEVRKSLFLECLYVFLKEKKLRLAKNGIFLEGSIEEQIQLFKDSFPSEEQMQNSEYENLWWFMDSCPAGVVWIIDEEIEGFTTPAENGKHYFWA